MVNLDGDYTFPVIFNRLSGVVQCGEGRANLTRFQAKILLALIRSGATGASHDLLYEEIWTDEEKLPDIKIINVQVCNLRKRLHNGGIPSLVETLWGVGYAVTRTVNVVPVEDEITIRGDAIRLLRELLLRCRSRPADVLLAERVRQAVGLL